MKRVRVRFSCGSCKGSSVVVLERDELDDEFIRQWADLVVGRSELFVKPIEPDYPGAVGRCGKCGVRDLSWELLAPEVEA